jgi:hypothetical protein
MACPYELADHSVSVGLFAGFNNNPFAQSVHYKLQLPSRGPDQIEYWSCNKYLIKAGRCLISCSCPLECYVFLSELCSDLGEIVYESTVEVGKSQDDRTPFTEHGVFQASLSDLSP